MTRPTFTLLHTHTPSPPHQRRAIRVALNLPKGGREVVRQEARERSKQESERQP